MKATEHCNSRTFRVERIVAASLLAGCLALALPATAAPAETAAVAVHEARTEERIRSMHERLQITPAQEELWGKVVTAMRVDARTMDGLLKARISHAATMNALEDLQSYGEVTDAHASGIHQLTQAFTPLYDGMSDAQKKVADTLFRKGPGAARSHPLPSHS